MKDKIIISALVALIVLIVWAILRGPIEVEYTPIGGGSDEAMTYKNITSADASATVPVVVRRDSGVLGSITIASSSPVVSQGIRVYDACCSATSTATSTLIGTFDPNGEEKTFPLNYAVKNGIVIDVPSGYNGSIIVGSQ